MSLLGSCSRDFVSEAFKTHGKCNSPTRCIISIRRNEKAQKIANYWSDCWAVGVSPAIRWVKVHVCCLYRSQITAEEVELSQLDCTLFPRIHRHIHTALVQGTGFKAEDTVFSSIHSYVFHFLNSLWPTHWKKWFSPFRSGSPNSRWELQPCLLLRLSPLCFVAFQSGRKLQSQKRQSNCSVSIKTIQSELCYFCC